MMPPYHTGTSPDVFLLPVIECIQAVPPLGPKAVQWKSMTMGKMKKLNGSPDKDRLNSGSARDVLRGLDGNDTLDNGAGTDALCDGIGVDSISYAGPNEDATHAIQTNCPS
jgi:hypothetical protein